MQARILGIALALLGMVFIGFAWWVYFAAEGNVHWAIPVLCTGLPILLAIAMLLVQRLAARKGAAGLERALSADAIRQQRQAPMARSAEVDRLKTEFERAVAALKHSKLAKTHGSARDALYQLPWYTIIGPPASGKTTVLRNSGLKFPYLPGTGDRLKGIGGTRNCDWWLTNEAILLDTAGRWTLEEDDRDEWLTFLDLLKRHRSHRPLNGVIAAISLAGDTSTSLASADTEGVKLIASRMRERLDEVTGRLGVAMPVYLMFTKCDLISGFVETFGDMTPRERQQIWGFTAPLLASPLNSPSAFFEEQFDALCAALEHRAILRMGQEVQADTVARIYEFPAQLRALREKLSIFVGELFEENVYGETPILRGTYFTSGTQEGAPADLLLEDMAQALQIRAPQEETAQEKKSYFLHDMLMNVVFEDQHLATASQSELIQQQKRRRIVTTGLFVGSALVAGLPAISCQQNLQSMEQTRSVLAPLQDTDALDVNATTPASTTALASLGGEIDRYRAGKPSMLAGFGLYQGDDLKTPLVAYYGAALKEGVIRPLMNRNNETLITVTQQFEGLRMQAGGAAALDDSARADLFNALKLHLLLTTPRDSCVPKPLARKDWVSQRLLTLWEKSAPARDRAETVERQGLIVQYLELLSATDELAIEKSRRRVDVARSAIGSEDKVGQVFDALLERFGDDSKDLTKLVGASAVFQGTDRLHGAYTLDAWRQTARVMESGNVWSTSDDGWVLGCGDEKQETQRVAQRSETFERDYLQRYEEQWRRFVNGLSARSPSNAAEAETMLGELVGRPGVLGNLFLRLKEHTDLPPLSTGEPEGALAAVAGELKQKANDQAAKLGNSDLAAGSNRLFGGGDSPPSHTDRLKQKFAGFVSFGVAGQEGIDPPLEQYRRQLEPVLMALKAYREDESKLDELTTTARGALSSVEMLLSSHAGEWSGRLRELLLPPLAGITEIAMRGRGGETQRLWCDLVYRPFEEELAGRFPMQIGSRSSATIQAFERFFQPGSGAIWSFQSKHLQGFVVQEGDRFRFASQAGTEGRSLFREDLLTFLNRAWAVRQAFFPDGSSSVHVPYRLRVRGAPGYSVTAFKVGSKSVTYDSGAETWTPMVWPGEQPSLGASLAVTPYQGAGPRPLSVEGEWGLFMILDEAIGHSQILERSERQFTAGWKPKGSQHWVKVDFAADDRRSPLMSAPFGRQKSNLLPLKPPARVIHAGSGC